MSQTLSIIIAAITAALGFVQIAWAMRLSFPFRDEATLARAVIGRRGVDRMPSVPTCLALASAFFLASALALSLGFPPIGKIHKLPVGFAGLFVGQLFLFRGMIGVMPAFEQALPEQPFLRLNRHFYSPLFAVVGLGFIALAFLLPNWSWRLKQIFAGYA